MPAPQYRQLKSPACAGAPHTEHLNVGASAIAPARVAPPVPLRAGVARSGLLRDLFEDPVIVEVGLVVLAALAFGADLITLRVPKRDQPSSATEPRQVDTIVMFPLLPGGRRIRVRKRSPRCPETINPRALSRAGVGARCSAQRASNTGCVGAACLHLQLTGMHLPCTHSSPASHVPQLSILSPQPSAAGPHSFFNVPQVSGTHSCVPLPHLFGTGGLPTPHA
jgi:hypothetical protein